MGMEDRNEEDQPSENNLRDVSTFCPAMPDNLRLPSQCGTRGQSVLIPQRRQKFFNLHSIQGGS